VSGQQNSIAYVCYVYRLTVNAFIATNMLIYNLKLINFNQFIHSWNMLILTLRSICIIDVIINTILLWKKLVGKINHNWWLKMDNY